ncbi:MAG: pilus assembly protein [Methanobacteriaceae archaeon]|nr:pilus assembly protein [Methanobacteriaceae archaeon]
MITSNTNVDISINKIKMIRPNTNPRSCNLNLNVDWSIEYIKSDEGNMEYVCTLKSIGEMPLQFAVQGILECKKQVEDLEKRSHEISPLILEKCMKTMMNLINITKNDVITIKTVPEVYLNCVYDDFKN